MAALKSQIALPRVPSGPDKNVGLCHSFFQKALASEVPRQGVCVCFGQWLNQCLVHALVGRRADRAIEVLSTQALRRAGAEKHYKTHLCPRGCAMKSYRALKAERPSPNQPMERTPPCCALRRRSSAR